MVNEDEWQSAEEFLAELERDPEYCQRRAARRKRFEERRKLYAALEQPILADLGTEHIEAASITDLIQRYSPLSSTICNVLLRWVARSTDARLLEMLIRALAAAGQRFDGRQLVKCYRETKDENLKWVILNTIAITKPHSIDEWLDMALKDPIIGKQLHDLAGPTKKQ
jgi:hypothetical protein